MPPNPGETGAIPSSALLLHRTAVIWEGAPTALKTVLLEWEKLVPVKEYIGAALA